MPQSGEGLRPLGIASPCPGGPPESEMLSVFLLGGFCRVYVSQLSFVSSKGATTLQRVSGTFIQLDAVTMVPGAESPGGWPRSPRTWPWRAERPERGRLQPEGERWPETQEGA